MSWSIGVGFAAIACLDEHSRHVAAGPALIKASLAALCDHGKKCLAAWYKAYKRAYALAHPEVKQLSEAKRRAQRKGSQTAPITRREWETLKAIYRHRCAYCGAKPKRLTQDHIIPLANGGTHTLDNVPPACWSCNHRKGVKAAPPHQLSFVDLLKAN